MAINIEEIKSFFEQDEGKEFINSIVEKETLGLKNKRDELLGSLKQEKENSKKIFQDLENLRKEKDQIEMEKLTKEGDIDKIKQELYKKHSSELEDLSSQRDQLKTKLHTHVVEQNLTAALVKNGVAAPLLDGAKALLQSKYSTEISEDNNVLVPKIDGINVDEFIAQWSQGDTGKHFISAAKNNGGGSNGANSGGKAEGGITIERSTFNEMSQADRRSFFQKGGKLIDN
jgi:hypothetical protein